MSELLPLFLKLEGRRVVLVGAGRVAAAKLPALVAAGADVTVVAPHATPEVAAAGVRLESRPFVPSDLDGAWLAVAAAVPPVNRAVRAAAEERRIFVNAVDDPAAATAYAGAVLRRDGVTVAISTAGEGPALAGLLREGLEALFSEDLAGWMATARRERTRWKAESVAVGSRRRRLLEALVRRYA